MSCRAVFTGNKGGNMSRISVDQHIRMYKSLLFIQLRKRLCFRTPERMIIRKHKKSKCLHSPVRRTGTVISLAHYKIRISVSYGQNVIPVKYRPPQPVTEMPYYKSLYNPDREWLYSRHKACGEETHL